MNNSYSLGQADPPTEQVFFHEETLEGLKDLMMWTVFGIIAIGAILVFRK